MREYETIRSIGSMDIIQIPKHVMNVLNVKEGDRLRIYIENDKMIVEKFPIDKEVGSWGYVKLTKR